MTAQSDVSPAPEDTSLGIGKLVVPSLIGGLVALTLGIYGRLHDDIRAAHHRANPGHAADDAI